MNLRFVTLSAADVAAWTELTNLLAQVDDTAEFYEAEEPAEELEEPGFDPERDGVAVWDGDQLVGFGQLRLADALFEGNAKASIDGGVDPGHRGRGIGREIMDRLETRARELAAERHPGAPVTVGLATGHKGSSSGRMAVSRGYAPVRYFTDKMIELPRDPGGEVDAVRPPRNRWWRSTPRKWKKQFDGPITVPLPIIGERYRKRRNDGPTNRRQAASER